MKKRLCGLLVIVLALIIGSACASPRPQGSFRLGGGGKDRATSAPLALDGNRLAVAILTHGGLGNAPHDTDEAQTWLACMDEDQNILWETLVNGMVALDKLDENGNIQAFCWYTEQGIGYSQLRVFSAATGELVGQKAAMPLPSWKASDDPSFHGFAMADYVLIQEIHDTGATTQPRILTLQDSDGKELWRIDQQQWQLENLQKVVQMNDGILLIGNSSTLEDGSFYHAMAVKLSFQAVWE